MLTAIFDTETTDLVKSELADDKLQPHIIEFFGVLLDEEGEIVEQLGLLCDPGVPITEEITRITGLKAEDVAGQPGFAASAQQVADFFAKAGEAVAHNLAFDRQVVDLEFARLKPEKKSGSKSESSPVMVWPKRMTCTVEETAWLKGHRLSLTALYEHLFGETFAGAHRAQVDVMALARCWIELKKRGLV